MSSKKVLILVVAYKTEKTISSVLARIPFGKLPHGTEVLVIGDSSTDRAFEIEKVDRSSLSGLKLTVLFNPENQGYGGNQKIGYQYAVDKGFDVVALLHGDGQYAPEKLPELLEPVLTGECDACFGSRIMGRGAISKKGMPLYKYVGNRILTAFQNAVLHMNLSEFHSGYRVYSVAALKQLPFEYNTNNFHFDTEIIIQFSMAGFRIKEIPISAYCGDEICCVNGIAYAWNVVVTTLVCKAHLMGIFFHEKYDIEGGQPGYDIKLGYVSSHTMAISAVSENASVLDLTCGRGYVARELKKKGCKVTGVDKESADPDLFEKFIRCDLDSPQLPSDLDTYDYILALDCLEHLDSPERLLDELRLKCYAEKTVLILTVPNIGFFITRLSLLLGQFNYGKAGILDLTHKRLFTFGSFSRLLKQEGYHVVKTRGIPAPYPKALSNSALSHFLLKLNHVLIFLWRRMFSYQIYVEARFLPPLDRLLVRTLEVSRDREC
ncbi:bifunctional glycosyltransferase/class I SAM-dependent methyltransferase [Verrucomicrobiota bacterium]